MSESTGTRGNDSDPGIFRQFQHWCSRPAETRVGRLAQLAVFLGLCFWLVYIAFHILDSHGLAGVYLELATGLSILGLLNNAGKTWDLFVDFSRFLDSAKDFDAFKAVPKVFVPAFIAVAVYSYVVGELHERTDPDSIARKILAPFERVRVFLTSEPKPPTKDETKQATADALTGHSSRLVLLDLADSDEGPSLVHNAVFPVRFGDATLATYPPSETFSIADVSWVEGAAGGLALTESQKRDLEHLTNMLKPCMGEKPVTLTVSGHASSLPFRHYGPGDISDELNLEAAKIRREAVVSTLTTLRDGYKSADSGFRPESLLINSVQHDSIDELHASAPFDDTPGGVSENAKNASHSLNQAVFVQFEEVGDCEKS